MKPTDAKNKILKSAAAAIAAAALLAHFVIWPSVKEIKSMAGQISANMSDLEERYRNGQSLEKHNEILTRIEPELDKLDKIFIKKDSSLEFIISLESVAERNNVGQKINLITDEAAASKPAAKNSKNKKDPEIKKDGQIWPLQIAADCAYADCLAYLTALEAMPYYINIKSIEINASAPGERLPNEKPAETGGRLSLFILAETFWK